MADATEELGRRVIESGFKPDYLIGITLGGLVPLMLLGKQLKNRNVLTITAQSYDGDKKQKLEIKHLPDVDLSGRTVLLIDEIADSGETLEMITKFLLEKYKLKDLKTAVLVCENKSAFKPNFFMRTTDEWVVFPWERAENPEMF